MLATPALAAVALAACGSSHFQYTPKATVPINVSVYIDSQRVSLSPNSITPGPTTITITNQASTAESLQVVPAGGSNALAETGPISPQGTAQVTVDLSSAGAYTISTAPNNSTEAAASTPTGILPGLLRVQGQRPISVEPQSP
jgi:hypothetical protein